VFSIPTPIFSEGIGVEDDEEEMDDGERTVAAPSPHIGAFSLLENAAGFSPPHTSMNYFDVDPHYIPLSDPLVPDGILADAYSLGMLLLCIELGTVVEVRQEVQIRDEMPDELRALDRSLAKESGLPGNRVSRMFAARARMWMARWDRRPRIERRWLVEGGNGLDAMSLSQGNVDAGVDVMDDDEDEDEDVFLDGHGHGMRGRDAEMRGDKRDRGEGFGSLGGPGASRTQSQAQF